MKGITAEYYRAGGCYFMPMQTGACAGGCSTTRACDLAPTGRWPVAARGARYELILHRTLVDRAGTGACVCASLCVVVLHHSCVTPRVRA